MLREECKYLKIKCSRKYMDLKDGVSGHFRILHNAELCELCQVRNIVRIVKCRRLLWAMRVAKMEETRTHTEFWWGNLLEKPLVGTRRG
jgi:hypothetical protein